MIRFGNLDQIRNYRSRLERNTLYLGRQTLAFCNALPLFSVIKLNEDL